MIGLFDGPEPIPSGFNQNFKIYYELIQGIWWAYRDLNSDGLPHWNLNPARLPVSPYAHIWVYYDKKDLISSKFCNRIQRRINKR